MSPESTRVCRNDTVTAGHVSPPTSPLCLWDSQAHLGVWPPGRYTAGTQQVHTRPGTGPGTQQLLQDMGTEGAPEGFHMGTLGNFAARPFNLSLLKVPFTMKQPHSPLADLQGPRLGSKQPLFSCFPEIPSRVLGPHWQGTQGEGAEPCDRGQAECRACGRPSGVWPPGLSQ